jgi:hypothetical protein
MLVPSLLGLGAAEALALLAASQAWWAAAALLHLAACGAAVALPQGAAGTRAAGLIRLVRLWLPALGPAAVGGALLALLLRLRPRDDEPRDLPDDPIEARLAAVAAARALPAGLLLEALLDALRWGTPRQRAWALDLAMRDLRTGSEALLRLAAADPDPGLRARIEAARPAAERRLLRRAEALRRRGEARELARHLDFAAAAGLLDAAQEKALRAEAAAIWRRIGAAAPGDAEAQAALGRDLAQLDQEDAARYVLEDALARGIATPALLGWLAECHFRARDFAALDALVARWHGLLEHEAASGTLLAPAWRLWLQGAAR